MYISCGPPLGRVDTIRTRSTYWHPRHSEYYVERCDVVGRVGGAEKKT